MGVLGEACGRDDISDRGELSDRVGTIITWEITLGAVNRKCLAPGLEKIIYPQDTCFQNKNAVGRLGGTAGSAERCLIYAGCIHDVVQSTDSHGGRRIR